jgi:hypothetical protein
LPVAYLLFVGGGGGGGGGGVDGVGTLGEAGVVDGRDVDGRSEGGIDAEGT